MNEKNLGHMRRHTQIEDEEDAIRAGLVEAKLATHVILQRN